MRFFFVATAKTRPDIARAIVDVVREWDERMRPHGVRVGVLVRYTKWRAGPCIPCRLALEYGLPVFIDNGAFTFLSSEDLEEAPDPFTLARWREDYALWLASRQEEYWLAALPDIPVHGRRFLYAPERRERIILSVRNQELFIKAYERILPLERLVPVVQGFEIHEYEESYRLLEEAGVLDATTYSLGIGDYYRVLAVGSVCVRKWSAADKTRVLADGKAAGTLKKWLPVFLNKCCREAIGFHLFGLHRKAVEKQGRHPRFHAADSGAHGFGFKFKWRDMGCKNPNTPDCAAKIVNKQLFKTFQPLLQKTVESYV